jgi:hypothetical protein
MTNSTLIQAAEPTTGSLPATLSVSSRNLGCRPDGTRQVGDIDGLGEAARTTIRHAGITAGAALLAMSVLSAFGYLIAVKGLVSGADAARTASKVAGHENLLRAGVLSLCAVAALDVVVAWALYRLFKPASEALSRLATLLRVAYAGVFMVAISQLIGALGQPTEALRHINAFTDIWDAGLLLFGLHLFLVAYLAYRSGYVPKVLGVLLAIAGFGYVFDTVVRVVVRGSSSDVSAITGIGEFVFALWLVIRGRRIASSDSASRGEAIGGAR